ncbi:preprotein translocase, SecY subunit [Edhazardia aedis USNM 41457]|uniref:Preprotein translocase, SecY subunit n=1 Tax=Edhazardia aedis (strain USNM 41457) TaxID=1003232 RepID=J9D9F6_EDHAE|nr:preprotein translocase, SecY subunit [Edhazardia aedis USNM 41457]|eukprot:EJW04124.1 preprotein translocase, SecY subunit [Edhazardia aedis USNM 41457]
MSFQILSLVKPFVPILPDIKSPGKQIYFHEKLVWTIIALMIYLIASQIPLFGIMDSDTSDPFYWMRMMMASNRGTLMDLGISPVITSSMILQALVNSDILSINYSVKEDRILYDACQKLLALIMTLGQAVAQVFTGFYGNPKTMNPIVVFLLITQLMFSGIIIILLDELLSKGYGIGSGVNLFIACNVCENIIWKCFSPKVYHTARGIEFEGAIISFIHLLCVRKKKLNAIFEAFFRSNLPNLITLLSTVLVFCIVIYFHGMRVELPLESTQVRGQKGKWPIKLFYSSTTPIIVQGYIVGHISTISKFLYQKFPSNFIIRFLGVWEMNVYRRMVPIKGLCHYIYPPENLMEGLKSPVTFLIYITFMILTSAILSRAWIDVNDRNAHSVAKQIKNQKMTIKGIREQNIESYLAPYISIASFLGGFIIGFICVLANVLDTVGSGTNIILAVGIVWQYFEEFAKENLKQGKVATFA